MNESNTVPMNESNTVPMNESNTVPMNESNTVPIKDNVQNNTLSIEDVINSEIPIHQFETNEYKKNDNIISEDKQIPLYNFEHQSDMPISKEITMNEKQNEILQDKPINRAIQMTDNIINMNNNFIENIMNTLNKNNNRCKILDNKYDEKKENQTPINTNDFSLLGHLENIDNNTHILLKLNVQNFHNNVIVKKKIHSIIQRYNGKYNGTKGGIIFNIKYSEILKNLGFEYKV